MISSTYSTAKGIILKGIYMIPELIKIANTLDIKGFYKEASIIDSLIKYAIEEPLCECDMLFGGTHDSECEWLKWKSSGKPENWAQQIKKDTALRKYLYGFKSDLELVGAKRIRFFGTENNMLEIEYKMQNNDEAEDFDNEFLSFNLFDEVLGNILVEGGMTNDGTNVGLYLEVADMPQGKNLADYVKDIFKN